MEDQGFDEAEIAEYWEELHEGYGSNGEADAAEYASQEEYDTAIGAELEDDAEGREGSSDTDSGGGGG